MTPNQILSLNGVLGEAKRLIEVEGYTMSESAHAIRKKYNPLENEKKKTMASALSKRFAGQDIKVNEEARSKNIYLVGKNAQRVLNTYNKWKGTNHTLIEFVSYEKITPKAYGVILKDGQKISITGREIRKIRNTRLLTFLNFGFEDIENAVCPASGLPFVFNTDIFETKGKVEQTHTFDLHHMDVSVDGKSELKNGMQPSKIILELDLFEQENIDALTEFFGMIMLSPSGHKSIHSNYSNEVHEIDDSKLAKRPYAIRSEKNYLRFFKQFNLTPKYTFAELAELLGFTVATPKKRGKKLSEAEKAVKQKVANIFNYYNSEENYARPVKDVYADILDSLALHGLENEKYMQMKSFGSFRSKRAKELGWN